MEDENGLCHANILPAGSKRRRRAPERYVENKEYCEDLARLMTEDIPEDELQAALVDEVDTVTDMEDESSDCEGSSSSSDIGFIELDDGPAADDDEFMPHTSEDEDEDEEQDIVVCTVDGTPWTYAQAHATYRMLLESGNMPDLRGLLRVTDDSFLHPDGSIHSAAEIAGGSQQPAAGTETAGGDGKVPVRDA